MAAVTTNNFGLLIAYIVPGFMTLCGLAELSPTVEGWLGATAAESPTVSDFLYATIASVAVGLFVNALRWHVVDPIHFWTGVPRRDYSKPQNTEALAFLVGNQFRYYEFYANSLVAVAFSFCVIEFTRGGPSWWRVALFLAVEAILWSASRRTLRNYHLSVEGVSQQG